MWNNLNYKKWRRIYELIEKKAVSRISTKAGSASGELVSGGGCGGCVNTTTISSAPTYFGTNDDLYIGVDTDKATTVYLPADARDGKVLIVKAEMKPPIGDRKIIITTTDGSSIDGAKSTSIRISYGYVVLIRNNSNWFSLS